MKQTLSSRLMTRTICGALVWLTASMAGAAAPDRTIVLREYLGQNWKPQLLFYAFEATQEEECTAANVRLTGPDGLLPVQLVDVETWPDTAWVKSGRLTFIDTLGPRETKTYRVSFGPSPASMPAPDLRVSRHDLQIEITTTNFGLRLPVGGDTYATPVAVEQVPGPVAAMRRPNGSWFGGSRLFGDARIRSWQAQLTEQGPVLVRWQVRYLYEDGLTTEIRIELAAGDKLALWESRVTGDDQARGWELLLDTGLPPLVLPIRWETQSQRPERKEVPREEADKVLRLDLADHAPGLITKMTPWPDWWTDFTQTVWTFENQAGQPVLRAASFDPGRWVEPLAPGTLRDWSELLRKQMPLEKRADGRVALVVDGAAGERAWLLGTTAGAGVGRRLNSRKDYVLEWTQQKAHPHLFLTAEELVRARPPQVDEAQRKWMQTRAGTGKIGSNGRPHGSDSIALGEWQLTGDDAVARRTGLPERLKHHMGLLGGFDKMRHVSLVCALYDALIDSSLIADEDRPRLRAQMAYLGYVLADPGTWSNERGYRAYPLNMSVAYALNLGTIAATIPDHPMAATWAESAVAMMDKFLAENVGPAGEWPESVANYAYVSTSSTLPFAIMARNAGLANFIDDPRMKRLMLYLAKQYTPPDPRHTEGDKGGQRRLLPPVGRGGAGGTFGLAGAMARATLETDPKYSAMLQWVWAGTGYSRSIANTTLGGWEWIYMDPRLPAQNPDWQLDYFPRTGTIMRQGMGTPDEWYVYLMAENHFGHISESGGFPAIFARGTPISSRFAGGYAEREEIFISRILPAREAGTPEQRHAWFDHDGTRRISDTSALPRQQYLRGEYSIRQPMSFSYEGSSHNRMRPVPQWPTVDQWAEGPITWNRQVLFVHADAPDGAGYLVLRDSVYGNQPTMWQFWTVSDKIGRPEQVADRATFLSDAPGKKMVDARLLPAGNRYTAAGQFDLDVEFYIAAPTDTPRHTLRWGIKYDYSPSHGYEEYQDMLHLQRPDDGVYFVAIFPRQPDEPVPTFATLGDGKVIEVRGNFGRDLVFLSDHEAQVEAGGASFLGTAASVQDRGTGLVMCVGAPGSLAYRDRWLKSRCPASLRQNREDELIVEVPAEYDGLRWVEVCAPGEWELAPSSSGVTVGQWPGTTGGWLVQFEPGCSRTRLVKRL